MKTCSLFPSPFVQNALETGASVLRRALLLICLVSPLFSIQGADEEIHLTSGLLSRGRYQFSLQTKIAQTYQISVSTNLVQWTLLTNLSGTGDLIWFSDFDAPKFPQRFYQIIPPAATNLVLSNMVFIPPGSFTMGSPASEVGRSSSEGPQTAVTLTHGFWMGKFETTQDEFFRVTGTNYSFWRGDGRLPAEGLSWEHATNYCATLTQQERAAGRLPKGYSYRLPTEAEWEYACRAGTTTPFGIGDGINISSQLANFDGNFPYGTAAPSQYNQRPVTTGVWYPPNAWGLYDMHGNVLEWVQDWSGPYQGGTVTDPKGPATGTERVLRGGGYQSLGKGIRSAQRESRRPGYQNAWTGFRVVVSPIF